MIFVIRIGPYAHDVTPEMSTYVAIADVDGQQNICHRLEAPDIETGLRQMREHFKDETLYCLPALAEVGTPLGFAVLDPAHAEVATRWQHTVTLTAVLAVELEACEYTQIVEFARAAAAFEAAQEALASEAGKRFSIFVSGAASYIGVGMLERTDRGLVCLLFNDLKALERYDNLANAARLPEGMDEIIGVGVRIEEDELPFAAEAMAWVGLKRLLVPCRIKAWGERPKLVQSELLGLTAALRALSQLATGNPASANGEVTAGDLVVKLTMLEGPPTDFPEPIFRN